MYRIFHITWVTHNSRISERMIEYEAVIRNRRINKGLQPFAEPTLLNEQQEIEITRIIERIVLEDNLQILAYNICRDHVHLVIVCTEYERNNIVRKLKGKSTQRFKEYYRIEEQFHLWAQKYRWKLIEDDDQLYHTTTYIINNRLKHDLPDSPELRQCAQSVTRGCSPL